MKKRIFSGAQPTGELHIGNYLGALKNWVALQNEYESFFCIVNLHAITLPQNPTILKQKTLDLARTYLAAGINPEKSTIFIQSDVAEHAELTWVLNCIARMGELERMTQFKEKSQKSVTYGDNNFKKESQEEINKNHLVKLLSGDNSQLVEDLNSGFNRLFDTFEEIKKSLESLPKDSLGFKAYIKSIQQSAKKKAEKVGVGLFTYPVLMASDILLYQTNLVPVGQDQKQHLELTRDLAERFNRDFGETFIVPEPFIPPVGAKIQSLQDPSKKMSKSDENVNGSIFLLDDADTIVKKFKKAVTNSGTEIKFDESRPAINNLLTIYQLMTDKTPAECETNFEGKGYGHFKTELAEAVIEFLKPFQEKAKSYTDAELNEILKNGAEKARTIARETLQDVYGKMGIVGAVN